MNLTDISTDNSTNDSTDDSITDHTSNSTDDSTDKQQNISLQEMDEKLQKFEDEESKYREQFDALYAERKKEMEEKLDNLKNEIINSALSTNDDKPPLQ